MEYANLGINVTMILAIVILIAAAIKGWKLGLVQEIVSLVSLVALVGVLLLLVTGVKDFFDGQYMSVIFILVLLFIVGIATKIGTLVVKLTKSVVKLPVLSIINKLSGILVGLVEGVVFIWVAMTVMIFFEDNAVSQFFITQVSENAFLHYLYNVNVIVQYFVK